MKLLPVIGMYSLYWSIQDQFKLTAKSRGRYIRWSTRFPYPQVLMADSAWFNDHRFVAYAAQARARGAELWGLQHGGRYGMVSHDNIWQEQQEQKICDRWFSWGWAYDYAPSPRMVFRPRQVRERSEMMLFGVAGDLASETNPEWRRRLLNGLPALKLRPYSLRRNRREYLQTLDRIRLAIPENCGTVLLETLAADVPTVCCWDERTIIRNEAKPYLEMLEKAGIWHRSPESLIAHLKNLNIESWWATGSVRHAREEFVYRFARSQPDWWNPWLVL